MAQFRTHLFPPPRPFSWSTVIPNKQKMSVDIGMDSLSFIINHVFLPPKLPQEAESDFEEGNSALLKVVRHIAEIYHERRGHDRDEQWAPAVKMLATLSKLQSNTFLDARAFGKSVKSMESGDVLALHISAQNAGLILRQLDDTMVFESFEASPLTEKVIGTVGKLRCSYPGPAISVNLEKVKDAAFLEQLGTFLEKMNRNVLEQAAHKAAKAGSTVVEDRETQDPKFITEMLTGILRGIGSLANVQRIEKRIADDVLWDNARTPWRRSPLWLVVRVALQTTLRVPDEGHKEYKAFIVFLMAKLLDWAISMDDVSSDILFVMNAKLSRRVHKMRKEGLPEFTLVEARRVCDRAHGTLDERWTQAQLYNHRPLNWNPDSFSAEKDVQLSMDSTKKYLEISKRLSVKKGNVTTFTPNECKRINTASAPLPRLGSLQGNPNKEIILADFELWVKNNLGTWVASVLDHSKACERLGEEIEDYISAAKPLVASNPESNSIFLLTMMELWVALDKISLNLHPLLSSYYPGFEDDFLTPLLLPQSQQRIRLCKVEHYLRSRKDGTSRETADSVYSRVVTERSFAVRYFDSSNEHKYLRQQILDDAEIEMKRKEVQLKAKEMEYEDYLEEADMLDCECVTRWEQGWTERHRMCPKCRLISSAESMRIELFEMPLPGELLLQKAVVFELRCPLGFSIWRDLTFKVLTEVCAPPKVLPGDIHDPFETLDTYTGLQKYMKPPRRSRPQKLQWSSFTKSFLKSHYRFARLPTTITSIRVKNGLRYGLYDKEGGNWTHQAIGGYDILKSCTFRLPHGPYKPLQYTLRSTKHSPNAVLSRQSECPPDIQLHEYIAFGLVRSGHRVQWLNMLRELRSRTLRFNNEAVNMLFTQCAWQAGPRGPPRSSKTLRESHVDLKDEQFGLSLLSELVNFLTTIESNWQEVIAVRTLIMLAIQLLSFASDESITVGAARFLRDARMVCLRWTREISTKLRDCEPQEMRELTSRIVQVAAVCRETYNVEQIHLPDLLHSREDVAVLVECAIIIHDNVPAINGTLLGPVSILLDRDRRLSHAIEAHLWYLVQTDGIGLDLTCVWSAYRLNSSWKSLTAPNNRWMFCTNGGSGGHSQKVYYNLLTGKLLVDGLPLGKLPLDYVSHSTYIELFGEKVLDVYPSKMDGMIFQTKQPIEGHDVGFVMREKDLIIRIRRRKDSVAHQLIPHAMLHGDFPDHIIANHVHWLELSTNKIELRDKRRPWDTGHSWYISDTTGSAPSVLQLGADHRLVDVRSSTTESITSMLSPLEHKRHIDVRYGKDGVVSAHLPRLKLDFVINKAQMLECRQFPDMIIDSDQNIGTLTGLENRLVVSQRSIRSVLIPYGKVKFEQFKNHHVRVKIDNRGQKSVQYHMYTIDNVLGRLVGNGSLASHLYKIYLHAVTASCLPDTLTGRTGTEEALYLLRAAATWSFQKPEVEEVEAELFGLIQSLTPARVYYPKHMKTMQKITWSCLSPIAQHDEFSSIVGDVLAHARRLRIFGEEGSGSSAPTFNKEPSEPALLKRAAHRNAGFRTYEFGGSAGVEKKDVVYEGRDVLEKGSTSEARACYMSALVEHWPSKLNVCSDLMGVFEKWGELGSKSIDVLYDQKWLDQDLAEVWFDLYLSLIVSTREDDAYRLMFLLGTIAYTQKVKMDLIESLLAVATVDHFRWLGLPTFSSYNLKEGFEPNPQTLHTTLKGCFISYEDSDEASLQARVGEGVYELARRRQQTYHRNLEDQSTSFVHKMILQWPCEAPYKPAHGFPLLNIPMAMAIVTYHFRNWHKNFCLQGHVRRVQDTLDSINIQETRTFQIYTFEPCREESSSVSGAVPFEDLLRKYTPDLPAPPSLTAVGRATTSYARGPETARKHSGLGPLLRDFETSESPGGLWDIYIKDLRKSFKALKDLPTPAESGRALVSIDTLESCEAECEIYMQEVFDLICERLLPKRGGEGWMLYRAGLWPRISPMLLLQQLATNRAAPLTDKWKRTLVTYGKAISILQQSQRLLKLARAGAPSASDLSKELENCGHERWDQMEKTDWLLIEIENNLLVRPVQVDIASRMISPRNGQNSLMQLCMGEGKTSVIVPLAAAYLADAEKMVRVVVLKPLIGQMFQTLVQRLGGLVNRRIYLLPFSRRVKMGFNEARLVQNLFEECMKNRGILLAQPEHILSFKLLGLERLYNTEHSPNTSTTKDRKDFHAVAQQLLATQRWLRKNSRDILDESDEILSIRHELIYTIGSSRPVEGYPDRWILIQQILDLIRHHLRAAEFKPQHFEVEHSPNQGGFDTIRILNMSAGRRLLKKIASKIIAGHLPAFSFQFLPEHLQTVAHKFITDPKVHENECLFLIFHYRDNQVASNILYLLRGLIAHKLLLFVLHYKRWKVDYGLDPRRSKLAVPYRAKDSPSTQSEFSHPDVTITLTCLSYYYGGLTEGQLEICFRDLYKSDNPTMEYEHWLKRVSLPNHGFKLRHLNAVNLEDRNQWRKEIYPTFRYNKAVIDFYLSGVVFPMEAREFSEKLTTSGWDIAEKKDFHPTTGFSGTNDNQYLLPISITQADTQEQLNTNARVLSYLLQSENSYILAEGSSGERLKAEQLLRFITDSEKDFKVKVLLDVGAQVLELRNDEVANEWLKMVPESKAAVYFNDNDELTVVDRDGTKEPLMISAFAQRLDGCLVYLDEAHTRGTDLKLPSESRAVVTLGPNLTKDRLVQACMRMRKLGNGHSVLFCGPPEVHRKILKLVKKADSETIEVRDVLHWCMMETCSNTRRLLPIWAKQGISHIKRYKACSDLRLAFPHSLLEQESKSLEEHYGFKRAKCDILPSWKSAKKADGDEFDQIYRKCNDFGVTTFAGAPMLEEQERELSHEIERERVLERPPKVEPINHQVTRGLKELINNGNLPPYARRGETFIPAFRTLRDTSAKDYIELGAWPETIFVTQDFATVVGKRGDMWDDYLRPVSWILSIIEDPSTLVILSPYEVNDLLPLIRQSRSVILHMYSPRTAKANPSYETLDFCTIPQLPNAWQPKRELMDSVNIFAGQLYFSDYETYERICGILGLYLKARPPGEKVDIGSDGFVERSSRKTLRMEVSTFTKSPVPFLRALVGIRRKGQNYAATHIGHILNGRFLSAEDFENEESESKEGEIAGGL